MARNLIGAKKQARQDIKIYIDKEFPMTTDFYWDNYNVRLCHIFDTSFTTKIN